MFFKLSFLQIIVSASLSAQYSHFPLSYLEVNGIKSEKFTESSAVNSFEITPDIVKFPLSDSQPTTPTLTKSPIENETSLLDIQSLESSNIDLGMSKDLTDKSDLDLKYIDDLPATPRIDFHSSSTFFGDFVFFLKDLFDDDNNFSEAKWSDNLHYLKYNSFAYDKLFQFRESGIENLSISSVLSPSSTSLPIEQPFFEKPSLLNQTVIHEEIISSPHPANRHTHYRVQNNSEHITDSPTSTTTYDIFETNSLVVQSENLISQRSRRGRQDSFWNAGDVASWDIDYFDPNSTSNEAIITFDNNISLNTTDGKFKLNIVADGTVGGSGVGNLAVFAYGHIGGGAWIDLPEDRGFKFMTNAGGPSDGNVTSYFDLNSSGIDAWLNPNGTSHNSFLWGVYKNGSDYFLTYDSTTDLTLSQAPEPSTYVMTGALLCFIGFNQKSRKSLKKIFNIFTVKSKLPSYLEKLTRSQSRS
jgi:hypothetical protein